MTPTRSNDQLEVQVSSRALGFSQCKIAATDPSWGESRPPREGAATWGGAKLACSGLGVLTRGATGVTTNIFRKKHVFLYCRKGVHTDVQPLNIQNLTIQILWILTSNYVISCPALPPLQITSLGVILLKLIRF